MGVCSGSNLLLPVEFDMVLHSSVAFCGTGSFDSSLLTVVARLI